MADNTNIKIYLRQSEDAEYVAGLAGTRSIVKRTEQTQATQLGEDLTGLDEYWRLTSRPRNPGRFKASGLFDGQLRTPFFPKDHKKGSGYPTASGATGCQ